MDKNDLKEFEKCFPEKTQFKHLKDKSIYYYLENGKFIAGYATAEVGEVSSVFDNADEASKHFHSMIVDSLPINCPLSRTIDPATMDIIDKQNHGFYAGGELEEILCFTCDDGTALNCSFNPDGTLLNNPFE